MRHYHRMRQLADALGAAFATATLAGLAYAMLALLSGG